jgi:uncharacterized Zn-finger protein
LPLRDFQCDHCDKSFKLKQHLKNHEKSHFENSLIPCTFPGCVKKFTRRNRLDLHLKAVHSGLKLFKCMRPDCSRAFSEKGNLMVHMRTHTGEKPYACKYCKRVFTSVGNKKDHERRHQNQRYSCLCIYLIGHIFAASVRRATTGNINCRSTRLGKDIKMMKKKSKTIIMS